SNRVVLGTGRVARFQPGLSFELSDDSLSEKDRHCLLTRVEHVGEPPDALRGVEEAKIDRERYINRFECIPTSQVFRPTMRTRRPRILGVQTAQVVGPRGEEVHTDPHGRVKIQFPWDRKGKEDENSSCWVRVAQHLAGVGWGFCFVPRIGM